MPTASSPPQPPPTVIAKTSADVAGPLASVSALPGADKADPLMATGETIMPSALTGIRELDVQRQAEHERAEHEHDEAGYHADQDEDNDSEDEGLLMGGRVGDSRKAISRGPSPGA